MVFLTHFGQIYKFCDCQNHTSPDISKFSNHSESDQSNLGQNHCKTVLHIIPEPIMILTSNFVQRLSTTKSFIWRQNVHIMASCSHFVTSSAFFNSLLISNKHQDLDYLNTLFREKKYFWFFSFYLSFPWKIFMKLKSTFFLCKI